MQSTQAITIIGYKCKLSDLNCKDTDNNISVYKFCPTCGQKNVTISSGLVGYKIFSTTSSSDVYVYLYMNVADKTPVRCVAQLDELFANRNKLKDVINQKTMWLDNSFGIYTILQT